MSKKLECEIVQDLLPMYVDHLTSDYTTQRVKEHLQECPPCHEVYELMQEDTEEKIQKNFEEVRKLRGYIKKFKVTYWFIGGTITFLIYTMGILIYEELYINSNTNVSSDVVEVTELYELDNGYIYANIRVTDEYFLDGGGTSFQDGEGIVDLTRTRVPRVYEDNCGGSNRDNACGLIVAFNPETSHVEHISFGRNSNSFIPINMSLIEYLEEKWIEQSRWQDKGNLIDVVYYQGKDENDRIVIWERGMELPKLEK